MKKILLLEDDKNLNDGITLRLKKEGYEVSSAFSLKEAEDTFCDDSYLCSFQKFP